MASLQDVKDIDIKTKSLINGYVRTVQEMWPQDNIYYTIPSLVIHWILLYYYLSDEFDPNNCNISFTLSNDNTVITHNLQRGDTNCSAYLKRIVDEGIHYWKFKLINVHHVHFTMCIGVWKSKHEIDTENALHYDAEGKHYTYNLTNQMVFPGFAKYGQKACGTGDEIEMILDLNKKELRYKVNNQDYGVAHDNIEQTSYQAAVSFFQSNDCIQLLEFKRLQ